MPPMPENKESPVIRSTLTIIEIYAIALIKVDCMSVIPEIDKLIRRIAGVSVDECPNCGSTDIHTQYLFPRENKDDLKCECLECGNKWDVIKKS